MVECLCGHLTLTQTLNPPAKKENIPYLVKLHMRSKSRQSRVRRKRRSQRIAAYIALALLWLGEYRASCATTLVARSFSARSFSFTRSLSLVGLRISHYCVERAAMLPSYAVHTFVILFVCGGVIEAFLEDLTNQTLCTALSQWPCGNVIFRVAFNRLDCM